jgi:hypothetical protein
MKARIVGVLYLLTLLAGVIAQLYVSDRLVSDGDAAATAANILTHRSRFEFGFTVYLIEMACQVAMTALLYELLKPAGRSVSLVAACLSLVGCVIKTMGRLFFLAPLFLLGGAHYLAVFTGDQLQALALFFLKVNSHAAGIGLAFFGLYAVLKGYLIVRSTFLPRILGLLSVIAGVGLLTFLSPTLGPRLFAYLAILGLVGALPQIGWLLVVGVDEQRWKSQAAELAALES